MLALAPDIRSKMKSRILDEEKYVQYPYTDTTGHLTVGIGRNLQSEGVSLDEALMMLDNDIMRCERDLAHYAASWYPKLDDVRKSVLIDMTFEMGIQGVLEFRVMIFNLTNGFFELAAKDMLSSKWAEQVPGRAQRLALIMETGSL